ncbi:unnamed protein product [Caenorhabditis auriculariae]|uniref:Uncharacterized protein n=1 Tax=Caenorhabditis auriculariae TaxID=2777116 RepID=A0A8S1H537_9PELO|nr:unnamed protein product [Caenorhabditis auriculariae]
MNSKVVVFSIALCGAIYSQPLATPEDKDCSATDCQESPLATNRFNDNKFASLFRRLISKNPVDLPSCQVDDDCPPEYACYEPTSRCRSRKRIINIYSRW